MRTPSILAASLACLLGIGLASSVLFNHSPVSSSLFATNGDGSHSEAKRPLDLPSGGKGGGEDEDIPEVISFYGSEFTSDAFFWLLDRSGSMSESNAIEILRVEVKSAIDSLSNKAEFGIVAFATTTNWWDTKPHRATKAYKASAKAWIDGNVIAEGWTCMAEGAGIVLDLANRCRKKKKVVIMVGDGMPFCGSLTNLQDEEVLTTIAAHNPRRIQIDTVFVHSGMYDETGQNFYKTISNLYKGTFTQAGGD